MWFWGSIYTQKLFRVFSSSLEILSCILAAHLENSFLSNLGEDRSLNLSHQTCSVSCPKILIFVSPEHQERSPPSAARPSSSFLVSHSFVSLLHSDLLLHPTGSQGQSTTSCSENISAPSLCFSSRPLVTLLRSRTTFPTSYQTFLSPAQHVRALTGDLLLRLTLLKLCPLPALAEASSTHNTTWVTADSHLALIPHIQGY